MAASIPAELAVGLFASKTGPVLSAISVCIIVLSGLIGTAACAGFAVRAIRTLVCSISLGGKRFMFIADEREFRNICVPGYLLSVLTLGLYGGRYASKIARFLVRNASIDGKSATISAKDRDLSRYWLDGFMLPLAVWAGAFFALTRVLGPLASKPDAPFLAKSGLALACICVLAVPVPFICLFARWASSLKARDSSTRLAVRTRSATIFVLGQLALTVFSAGLFFPLALVNTAAYCIPRIEITGRDDIVQGRLSFTGSKKEGFLYIWGKSLLVIGTLGLYLPWAIADIIRWFFERTGYVQTRIR